MTKDEEITMLWSDVRRLESENEKLQDAFDEENRRVRELGQMLRQYMDLRPKL